MRVDTDCSSVCNLKSTQKMKANHEGALNKEGRRSFVCEMQITHPRDSYTEQKHQLPPYFYYSPQCEEAERPHGSLLLPGA